MKYNFIDHVFESVIIHWKEKCFLVCERMLVDMQNKILHYTILKFTYPFFLIIKHDFCVCPDYRKPVFWVCDQIRPAQL